ncbi:MAG: tyrosine-type recombinase/integrase [Rhodobacteraceae bacterium]|nr:tyrosine-type recombinase/integrase [Marivita sp. XM-24bin2]MCR9110072.1 tyrosine-type recombinase/integrase [Paracoccaceae bacterium]
MRLHDPAGNRLYLNAEERATFLAAARHQPARDRTLCETLHWTGCRPSELLEITPARIDLSSGTIAIRSLKKRRDASGQQKVVFRSGRFPENSWTRSTRRTAYGKRSGLRKSPHW